ncbi:MAG TPA: YceI family protein [Methylomirabilota bacterium]|jgi:polyisoprenoid-binding protein YceI
MRGPPTPSRGPSATAPTPKLIALALLLVLALPLGAAAAPTTFVVEPTGSELKFFATSRLMNAEGRFHRFSGRVTFDRENLADARVTFSVETASIDTANRLRDDHLRSDDFFAVARFPTATFESERVERASAGVTVIGRLTIRGVTRPLTIPVQVEVTEHTLRARGEFEIQRIAFGVAYQSRLNPVGDVVRVVFTFAGRAVSGGASSPPPRGGAPAIVATSDSGRSIWSYPRDNTANPVHGRTRDGRRLDRPGSRQVSFAVRPADQHPTTRR